MLDDHIFLKEAQLILPSLSVLHWEGVQLIGPLIVNFYSVESLDFFNIWISPQNQSILGIHSLLYFDGTGGLRNDSLGKVLERLDIFGSKNVRGLPNDIGCLLEIEWLIGHMNDRWILLNRIDVLGGSGRTNEFPLRKSGSGDDVGLVGGPDILKWLTHNGGKLVEVGKVWHF